MLLQRPGKMAHAGVAGAQVYGRRPHIPIHTHSLLSLSPSRCVLFCMHPHLLLRPHDTRNDRTTTAAAAAAAAASAGVLQSSRYKVSVFRDWPSAAVLTPGSAIVLSVADGLSTAVVLAVVMHTKKQRGNPTRIRSYPLSRRPFLLHRRLHRPHLLAGGLVPPLEEGGCEDSQPSCSFRAQRSGARVSVCVGPIERLFESVESFAQPSQSQQLCVGCRCSKRYFCRAWLSGTWNLYNNLHAVHASLLRGMTRLLRHTQF